MTQTSKSTPRPIIVASQVTLYQLLMEERYGEVIERGLLWYLGQDDPEIIHKSPYEVCLTNPLQAFAV